MMVLEFKAVKEVLEVEHQSIEIDLQVQVIQDSNQTGFDNYWKLDYNFGKELMEMLGKGRLNSRNAQTKPFTRSFK